MAEYLLSTSFLVRFGRRKIVLVATFLNIVCGLGSAIAPNITSLLILRFLWANFATGKTNTDYVLGKPRDYVVWICMSKSNKDCVLSKQHRLALFKAKPNTTCVPDKTTIPKRSLGMG